MSQSDSRPTEFVVPVVDISAYVGEGSTDERAAVAKAMDNACATVGFVQVVGHGIPAGIWDGLGDASDAFFNQSLAEKKKYLAPAIAATPHPRANHCR